LENFLNNLQKEESLLTKPIAVIDSGVGGLTVAQELIRQIPREKIVYFGDTARCPYGNRSNDEVQRFVNEIVEFLKLHDPKMLVIACNTATAVVLEELRETSKVPVIGVIHPGVRAAIKATLTGRIGVIGTIGTIRSGSYENALRQIHPDLYIKSEACPTLVPLVERGQMGSPEALDIVNEALTTMKKEKIDTLILGCTHYPLIANLIQDVMGNICLISSADETAREVSTILFHKNMFSNQFIRPKHLFYTSGDISLFKKIANDLLLQEVEVLQHTFE
jgi:glutamate racemase